MIYLDNAATTKPCDEAVKAMLESAEVFGNPSSLHGLGLQCEKKIKEVKEIIARNLSCDLKNIYFTSGGTEANNTIISGVAYARRKQGEHLVTTMIEHPSVIETFKKLEADGFCVTYLKPDTDGRISIDDLKNAITDKTTLISIMHVNNETGVIQPVDEVRDAIIDVCPDALIHSDCVQSFGKIPVNVKKLKVDFVTISAHKIHGFKGVGAMYISDKRKIRPMILGGEQQEEIRPGTENVGGIFAFGAATNCIKINSDDMREKREYFKNLLLNNIDNIKINGSDEFNSGSVLNVSFLGLRAEILLHSLEAKGVYVSTGSACSSHKPQQSHVLAAMDCTKQEIDSAIRFSFNNYITKEELENAAEIISKEVAQIRRFIR